MKRKRQVVTPISEWSNKELEFFKIKIEPEINFEMFFGEPPSLVFSNDILEFVKTDMLETIDWDSIKSEQVSRLVRSIISVIEARVCDGDFIVLLFKMFGYDEGNLTICVCGEIQLEVCGYKTSIKPDLFIETSSSIIKFIVKEYRSYQVFSGEMLVNVEAQIIAEAIGAFQETNNIREKFGKFPKESQLIPCIIMVGTCPIFYLFTVTKKLTDSVKNGERPKDVTIIKQYKIPIYGLSFSDAILVNDYKLHIFQCYTALKKFITNINTSIYALKHSTEQWIDY